MCSVKVRIEVFAFVLGTVLIWVCCFVFEHLDEFVEAGYKERPKDWPNPINPVIAVELVGDD
jgi:hypothetical protein